MAFQTWWIKHRTVVGAVVATAALIGFVASGRMHPDRMVVPLVFAWMLALHSIDNRQMSERYERSISAGLAGIVQAGIAFRPVDAGKTGVQD